MPQSESSQLKAQQARLIFLVVGTLGSFSVFGYAQEALATKEYEGKRFGFATFLVFLQSVGNAFLAALLLLAKARGHQGTIDTFLAGVPMREWLVVALGYFGAHIFGLLSLKFIIFPLQVVLKSCKPLPVMVGDMLFAKISYTLPKKISVILTCAGVIIFTMSFPHKQKRNGSDSFQGTLNGLGLVFLGLICDGIYGPYQTKIVKEHPGVNAYHLMFNMNALQGLIALVICILDGGLVKAAVFIGSHPEVVWDLIQFGMAMALGNVFIYNLQREFGALVVTTTTTMRKLISVLFSVFYFGHSLTTPQWFAAGIVLLAPQISKRIALQLEKAAMT